MSRLASIGLVGLFALYPLAVYFGLTHLAPTALGLLVAVLAALRVVFVFRSNSDVSTKRKTLFLAGLLMVLGLVFALTGHEASLKLYPVAVNLVMLVSFGLSLTTDMSAVERIARWRHPDLPDHAIPYLRKVTIVWSVFFLLNGGMAYWSAVYGSRAFWALYNGLIAYGLIAALFCVEYLVRLSLMKRNNTASQVKEPMP